MTTGPIELMERARDGQGEALGELCSLYRNYLHSVARSGMGPRLRGKVCVSDVVQDALVDVVRHFHSFTGEDEAALAGWFRYLVRQKLADLGRYHGRAKRGAGGADVPLDGPPGDRAGGDSSVRRRLVDGLALSQTSPSEGACRRELVILLADALDGLPEREAEVLRLRHVDGLSCEAIAVRLGLTRKSVRGIWARGLKGLRRRMPGA
jgi:RNA polymerase sigma-70 factor (ECF subfamily)